MAGKGWNAVPAALERRSTDLDLLRTSRKAGLGATVCLALAAIGKPLLLLAPVTLQPVLGPLLCLLAGILALVSVQSLLCVPEARRARASSVQGLTDQQRRLFGLQLAAAGAAGAVTPTPAARPPKSPASFGPPLRGGRAAAIVAEIEQGNEQARASPLPGARSAGRESPAGARQVTTPEQLQRVLASFDESTQPEATEEQPQSTLLYGSPLSTASPGMGLTYRPSAVPRGAAPVVSESGKIGPSSQAARAAALERLGVKEEDLEFGEERLREWLAFHLLKPLVAKLDGVHADVSAAAARLGCAGVTLAPLADTLAGTNRASAADDQAIVDQMRQQLLGRLQALPAGASVPLEATTCLEACNTYLFLSALVKGEAPPNLLPPAPPSYILTRIRELADGSCVNDFSWNRGSSGWSGDLPPDASLLLYLLAAFLAAPHWIVPHHSVAQHDAYSVISSPAGTLYLGKPPARIATPYHGILSSRPPTGHKVTGLVGLLVSGQPMFQLLLNSEVLLTATGASALFDTFFLLLKYCQQTDGQLGGRSIPFLELQDVLGKQPRRFVFFSVARLLSRYT